MIWYLSIRFNECLLLIFNWLRFYCLLDKETIFVLIQSMDLRFLFQWNFNWDKVKRDKSNKPIWIIDSNWKDVLHRFNKTIRTTSFFFVLSVAIIKEHSESAILQYNSTSTIFRRLLVSLFCWKKFATSVFDILEQKMSNHSERKGNGKKMQEEQ